MVEPPCERRNRRPVRALWHPRRTGVAVAGHHRPRRCGAPAVPTARGHLGGVFEQRADSLQPVADTAGAARQGQDDRPVEDPTEGAGQVSGRHPSRDAARMASPRPGSSRRPAERRASGVTSRGPAPVPPVVTTIRAPAAMAVAHGAPRWCRHRRGRRSPGDVVGPSAQQPGGAADPTCRSRLAVGGGVRAGDHGRAQRRTAEVGAAGASSEVAVIGARPHSGRRPWPPPARRAARRAGRRP